jgi:hypothetical protein
MNPEELQKIIAEGEKRGYSPSETIQILRGLGYEIDDSSPVRATDIGRSLVQGATFNFGDEILGKLPEWLGGGEQARDEMRSRDKAFKKEHPIIGTGAEIAGGMAVPGFGAVGALGRGAMNIKRAIGAGAAIGGVSGGLAGAGAAEGDLGDRVTAAIPAAGAGAALGAVIPGGAAALRAGFSPASRAMARLRGAVAKSGGPEAVSRRAAEFEAAGRGQEATLADMSRHLQRATDYSVNNNDDARVMFENAFEPRAQEVNERITEDVTSRLGAPHAEQVGDDLSRARLAWADSQEGFEGLRQRNPAVLPIMGEKFDALLNQPRVRDALAQAREVGILGPMDRANGASFEVLQGTKERLDAAVGQAFGRPGLRDLGVRLRAARDQYVDLLRDGVPGYRDVADQYHAMHRLEEMLEHGQATYKNNDARGLRQFFDNLSTEERNTFRQGLVSEMIKELRQQNAGAPALRSMVRPGANKRDIMEIAFGSRKELEEFLRRSRTEIDMATTGRALGGSQTHGREMATVDPAGLAIDAMVNPGSALVNAARSVSPKYLASRTAREMAPTLTTQGAGNIQRLMQQWQREPQDLLGAMMSRRVPVAAGLLGSEMFGE